MAATSHPEASAAALDILEEGGNAMDAALAASAVLCMAEPHMTGIGGDCFVLYAPSGGDVLALNGSGRAPAAVDAARLRGQGLKTIAIDSPHAVTVPGAVDAWCRLHKDHATMPLERLFAPAIALAEEGCTVAPRVAHDWPMYRTMLADSPSARRLYLRDGEPYRQGERFHNPALGRTLRRIAAEGRAAFYEGEVAEGLIAFLKGQGGVHAVEDFTAQRCEYVTPISSRFGDHEIFECPPNGQGVIALMILNILEQFGGGFGEADQIHLLAEATRIAYGHRDAYLADPALAPVPVDRLLSKETARELAGSILMQSAVPNGPIPGVEHKDTVYLAVVDRDGNAVSFINSIFNPFGSALYEETSGVLLHSRGASFSLEEGHPNELAPGKRPLHTIIPGVVMRDGQPVAPFGVMGGHYQAAGQGNYISRVLSYGMDVQEALERPRSFASGGVLSLEPGYGEDIAADLSARGHVVERPDGPIGGGQAIWIDHDRGLLTGASDPRKDGCALGR